MLRTGLIAVLLLGLGSTAMASDRVRVYVGVDSYSGDVGYSFSYVDRGRGDWRRDGHRYDRRWDHRRWDDRRSYGYGRYYPAPRGYYYPRHGYSKPYRYGYSRGYYGGRHWHDRRHDHRHRH
jgi:hypothetical protein